VREKDAVIVGSHRRPAKARGPVATARSCAQAVAFTVSLITPGSATVISVTKKSTSV
jgi:hypothetical protein